MAKKKVAQKKDRPLVLVTGATGTTGPTLVKDLLQQNYAVRILARRVPEEAFDQNSIQTVLGEIGDSQVLRASMEAVDCVFHLAAKLHVDDSDSVSFDEYQRINVEGTRGVVEAAQKAGVRRVILFSTISVYGHNAGIILSESSTPYPHTSYARTKLAAEQILLAAKQKDGAPLGTVLRFGAIYRSRVKGNYRRLLKSVASGMFIPVGAGTNRRTLIYDKDAVTAAVLAMEHPAAAGKIYNVTDGRFHTINNIIAAICAALGRNPPRLSLPVGPVRWSAGVLEAAMRPFGLKCPLTRAIIDKYTEDVAVDSQRIQKELGFAAQYDLEIGWRETVRDMRQHGDL